MFDGNGNEIKILMNTDKTLSVPNSPADSKVAGEEIKKAITKYEPESGDIPKVYFLGNPPTSKNDGKIKLEVTYVSKTRVIHNWCTLKVQGDTSATYPKKNYNMVMYKDSKCKDKDKHSFRGWGRSSKFCLKANWIDHTHARNVVNAKLYGQMCRTRIDYESYPEEWKKSPNYACIDGFPVMVYFNGVYHGLYTWNIAKDDFMTNMDEKSGKHSMLIADSSSAGVLFQSTSQIDGTDWTDELNDNVPTWVRSSWRDVQNFVISSSDADFSSNIEDYFYLSSLLDRYIFSIVFIYVGGFAKSQAYYTYDGTKWISSMYDLDTSWALHWAGTSFYPVDIEITEENQHSDSANSSNRLFERIVNNFKADIKDRYSFLRGNVLTEANIDMAFENFITPMAPYLDDDYAITTAEGAYTNIPLKDTNNLQKLKEIIAGRLTYSDSYINNL